MHLKYLTTFTVRFLARKTVNVQKLALIAL